jgi:glycosyltransferase involved in cell wall biosynthesis
MPKVSVVVPVYNEEKHLKRCVESIIGQSLTDWQLILVDDGSTDESGRMCDRYAAEDPARITVVHQENRGYARARNRGLELVSGDYVMLVDADDSLTPDALEIVYSDMTRYDLDYVIGGNNIIMYRDASRTDVVASMIGVPETDYFFDTENLEESGEHIIGLCGTLFYCVWGRLYKTDIIREHGLKFDENLYVQEDVNFTFCYLYYVKRGMVTKEVVYNYSREFDKDDVGERPVIDQHFNNQASLQSFLRLAFKFKFSDAYRTVMYHRLSEQYLQLISKIYQERTGLSQDERRRHVYALTDDFTFRFFSEKLKDHEMFWKEVQEYLDRGELEKIYLRMGEKIKEDGLPRTGASNIR